MKITIKTVGKQAVVAEQEGKGIIATGYTVSAVIEKLVKYPVEPARPTKSLREAACLVACAQPSNIYPATELLAYLCGVSYDTARYAINEAREEQTKRRQAYAKSLAARKARRLGYEL